jgi:RHS repeat-associated protein
MASATRDPAPAAEPELPARSWVAAITGAASGVLIVATNWFGGREYDPTTQLANHRSRYYSPDLGRFISQDVVGLAGGSANPYQYALADPVNLADPNGDCPVCAVLLTGCVIGGLVSVGIGWGLSDLLDRKYSWSDGFSDFAIGCALGALTEGIGAELRALYGAAGALDAAGAAGASTARGLGGGAARAGTELVPKATTTLGKWGEQRLSQVLGGKGFKPAKGFKTSLGPRFVDRVIGRTAYEAKAG